MLRHVCKLLHCRQLQYCEAFELPAGMQLDSSDKAESKPAGADGEKYSSADGGKEGGAKGRAEGQKAKAPKEPEASSHRLDNPARVVPAQEKLVRFPEGSRYTPIRSGRTAGILLLKDSTPGTQTNKEEKQFFNHQLLPMLISISISSAAALTFQCSACCFCHCGDAVVYSTS